jgi:hypothetical protein
MTRPHWCVVTSPGPSLHPGGSELLYRPRVSDFSSWANRASGLNDSVSVCALTRCLHSRVSRHVRTQAAPLPFEYSTEYET